MCVCFGVTILILSDWVQRNGLSFFLQEKASGPGKGNINIRLLPGEGHGARLLALQDKHSAGSSAVRVWMGQGNGWSHPISLLDRQGGQVRELSLDDSSIYFATMCTLDLLYRSRERCFANAMRYRASHTIIRMLCSEIESRV